MSLASLLRRRLLDPIPWGLALSPLLLFGWMLWGRSTLGNDYPSYQVDSALNLRFYTSLGVEPMWFPHLSGGVPIGGLPLAQYFHLPAWCSSQLPGYWSGHALDWITGRHLVLLMTGQCLYYFAFRRLTGLGRLPSYLLSFIAIYNAKTLDAFRYGPALDATVYGHAVLLLFVAHVLEPSRLRLVLIIAATQLFLTCGYPVVLPFVLLGALMLLTCVLVASADPLRSTLRRVGEALAAALLGLILAAPNSFALAEWLEVNYSRMAHPTLDWANAWAMDGLAPLQSWVYPWAAEVNSAFGGSTLIGLVLLALVISILQDLRRSWPLLLFLSLPFLYALGAAAPVFPFFFRHLPGFSSLRVPGRILYLLPILVFGAVLWLKGRRGSQPISPVGGGTFAWRISALVNLGLCVLALLLLALFPESPLGGSAVHPLSPARLTDFWSPAARALWLGLGCLASAAFLRAQTSHAACGALVVTTVLQTALLMRYGTWLAEREPTPTRRDFESADHLPLYGAPPLVAENELSEGAYGSATPAYTLFMKGAGFQANCYLPVDGARRDRGVLLPFYLSPNWVCTASQQEALDRLKTEAGCRFSGTVKTLLSAADCEAGAERRLAGPAELADLNAGNRLLVLTPNRVSLEVDAVEDALLVTPFPLATPNWTGWLNGRPAPLLPVNGAFLGLRVPRGHHLLGVRYFSTRLVLGYRLFFLGVLAIFFIGGAELGRAWLGRRKARVLLVVGLFGAGVGGAVAGYLAWERGFVARAETQASLHHYYPEHLERQLGRWRQEPSGSR